MGLLERFSLDGRVALVTGASRGIGGAIALAFAEAGADVALVGRELATLEEQAHRVQAMGRRAIAIDLDVGRISALQGMVDRTVATLGRVDILFNGAGAIVRKPILEVTPDDWDSVLDVNLKAVYFASQAAARSMIAARREDPSLPRGKVIHIASMTSQIALPNISSYGTSRTAIVGLTRSMAIEWADHISVNALAPGYVRTRQTERLFEDPTWVEKMVARVPMRRFCELEDVTGYAVFLASSASDYVTGHVHFLDGGWLSAG